MKLRQKAAKRGVRSNAGLRFVYQKKLTRWVERMATHYERNILACYRVYPPVVAGLATDISPAAAMRRMLQALKKTWYSDFDKGAEALAKYYAQAVNKRSDAQLRQILKDAGFAIGPFTMNMAQKDVFDAIVQENVALIKSIPEQYHAKVEQLVMHSVSQGADQGELAKQLKQRYMITNKRAKLIARDQNFKANSALTRARQLDLDITFGVWKHSHAGKEPRPSHVANDEHRFDLRTGWFDPDERQWIMPGELINCRCTWAPIIPELES